MRRTLLVMAICSSLGTAFAGEPPDFDDARYKAQIRDFDQKTSDVKVDESKLNETEKRMNAVVIPEIDFRQADIFDIIEFFDVSVREYGRGSETNDATRLRIRIDKVNCGGKLRIPCITFACRKMPLLYAVKLTAELGGLQYSTAGNLVTLFIQKKEADQVPEDTARKLADPQH